MKLCLPPRYKVPSLYLDMENLSPPPAFTGVLVFHDKEDACGLPPFFGLVFSTPRETDRFLYAESVFG